MNRQKTKLIGSKKIVRAGGLQWRAVGNEVILLSVKNGQFSWLNETASRVWLLSDGSHTFGQLVSILHSEFKVDRKRLEIDTKEFIQKMLRKRWLKVK